MTKNYSTKSSTSNLKPKKSTIDFILSYSKSLNVVKGKKLTFETFVN